MNMMRAEDCWANDALEVRSSYNNELIGTVLKDTHLTVSQAIGLVVAITPFNYPLNLVAHKVGPSRGDRHPRRLYRISALGQGSTFCCIGIFLRKLHRPHHWADVSDRHRHMDGQTNSI